MKLFKRFLKIVLIKDGPEYKQTDAGYISYLVQREFREIPEQLKISVDISVSKKTGSDNGYVKIWNPNKETISFIRGGQSGIIEIYAGYEERMGLIFRGAIGGTSIVSVDTEGSDTIIKYHLGSYVDRIRSAYFRGSFAGQYPVKEILRFALDKSGIPHSGLDDSFYESDGSGVVDKKPTLTDFSYSGTVTELIKKLQDSYGLNSHGVLAFYENGVVRFTNATWDRNVKSQKVVVVSAETGLRDTPRWEHKHKEKKFKFKSVVNPEIIRGSVVEIISEKDPEVNGLYCADSISYSLSNRSEDFDMEVEVSEWKR